MTHPFLKEIHNEFGGYYFDDVQSSERVYFKECDWGQWNRDKWTLNKTIKFWQRVNRYHASRLERASYTDLSTNTLIYFDATITGDFEHGIFFGDTFVYTITTTKTEVYWYDKLLDIDLDDNKVSIDYDDGIFIANGIARDHLRKIIAAFKRYKQAKNQPKPTTNQSVSSSWQENDESSHNDNNHSLDFFDNALQETNNSDNSNTPPPTPKAVLTPEPKTPTLPTSKPKFADKVSAKQQTKTEQSPKKSSTRWIVLLVIVLIVMAGIIGFLSATLMNQPTAESAYDYPYEPTQVDTDETVAPMTEQSLEPTEVANTTIQNTENLDRRYYAPNGMPYPDGAGHIEGYPKLNTEGQLTIVFLNNKTDDIVYGKVFQIYPSYQREIRTFYVPPRGGLNIRNLTAGTYEVHYELINELKYVKIGTFTLNDDDNTPLTLSTYPNDSQLDGSEMQQTTLTLP